MKEETLYNRRIIWNHSRDRKEKKKRVYIISSTLFLQFQGQTVNLYHSHSKENKSRELSQWPSREKNIKSWIPANSMSSSSQNYSPHDHQERYLNSGKIDSLAFPGMLLNAFTVSNGCKHMHSNSLNQNNKFKTSQKTWKC